MNAIEKYNNWEQFRPTKTAVAANWNLEDLNFEWHKTIQTNEVPEDDVWESHTTIQKRYLEDLHKSWGVPGDSTKHYMSFSPELTGVFSSILEPFANYNYSCNLLKLTPGHMLVWHFDTYATFVNRKNVSEEESENIFRSAVMLTDWDCGQVIQIGNEMVSHWKKGDVFTWPSYTWHGTSNFGKSDMIVAQVSYLYE
jgi:hypothetical protein